MKLALPNPVGSVFEYTETIRQRGLDESRASPRRRMLFPMHRANADVVQRMLNFMQLGSYIRPHWHPREFASETIVVMEGELGFLTFDDEGTFVTTHRLPTGGLIDIEAKTWHGWVVLAPNTVILEIKRGPFNEDDKVYADWAPEEDSDEAQDYLDTLTAQFRSG